MDVNKNRRSQQDHSTGAHPATRATAAAAALLGYYLALGGEHPGTKPPGPPRDERRAARKRQRQARKRGRG